MDVLKDNGMSILRSVINYIKKSIFEINCFISFIYQTLISYISCKIHHSHFGMNPYMGENTGNNKVAVLANGPSLRESLLHYKDDPNFMDSEFMVMNFFCKEPLFSILKPKYYGLADPMFIKQDDKYEKVCEMFDVLNRIVDWEMTLVCPFFECDFLTYSKLNNPYIKIVFLNTQSYKGSHRVRNYLYRKGCAHPIFGTVAVLCVFFLLNKGYREINLYGVDMTFLESIRVNSDNELCTEIKHFYEEKAELKPYLDPSTMKVMKLSKYIDNFGYMLKGHEDMEIYSKYLNSNIYNCTKVSMLDCYNRKI